MTRREAKRLAYQLAAEALFEYGDALCRNWDARFPDMAEADADRVIAELAGIGAALERRGKAP